MLPVISSAINDIWHNPITPIYKGNAMDFLFHGMTYDCTDRGTSSRLVCLGLENEARGIEKLNQTHFKLSLFGPVSKEFFLFHFQGKKNL